ncbi:MAG: hypothetical protein ABJX32_05190 [Tateyamaria sp.]|uniref:hypothetical protein n=1 Tax=Tateyamaria sp. TaxID=1929288 RepID=UPI00329AD5D7
MTAEAIEMKKCVQKSFGTFERQPKKFNWERSIVSRVQLYNCDNVKIENNASQHAAGFEASIAGVENNLAH